MAVRDWFCYVQLSWVKGLEPSSLTNVEYLHSMFHTIVVLPIRFLPAVCYAVLKVSLLPQRWRNSFLRETTFLLSSGNRTPPIRIGCTSSSCWIIPSIPASRWCNLLPPHLPSIPQRSNIQWVVSFVLRVLISKLYLWLNRQRSSSQWIYLAYLLYYTGLFPLICFIDATDH